MKVGVFIGRFQIWSAAHQMNVMEAFRRAELDHMTIVIGTAFGPYTNKNPLTGLERRKMISAALVEAGVPLHKVTFIMMRDYPDNNDWANEVTFRVESQFAPEAEFVLVGMKKDHTSFYIDMFPHWKQSLAVEPYMANGAVLSATDLRAAFYNASPFDDGVAVLPEAVKRFLYDFRQTESERFLYLKHEQDHYDEYKAAWSAAPYPPTFFTADAVVRVDSGWGMPGVILIRRKKSPGKGLWAIPGGFVDQFETSGQAAARELFEETGLDINTTEDGSSHGFTLVDSPHRSQRGRVISIVSKFTVLCEDVPSLRPGDDADFVEVVPISEVIKKYHNKMFDDHYNIICSIFNEKGDFREDQ